MDVIYKVVQIFVCIFEVYLMFDFFLAFFSLKEVLQRPFAKVIIVSGTAACVFLINSLNSSVINIVAMQVIYLLMIFLAFDGGFLKRILYYIMATVIMGSSEFISIVLLSLPSDFSMDQMQESPVTMIFSLLCIKLLSFLLFNIVKRIPKNSSNKMDLGNLMLYIILPVAMLGIMFSMAYLNIDFDSMKPVKILLIFSSVPAVVGSVLIFYAFDRYSLSKEKLQQQELMITKLEMEKRHYKQIDEINREHSAMLHDIYHYMKALGEMAAENKDQDILNILSELKIKVSETQMAVICENRLLNAILNEKRKEAEDKGIAIKIVVEPEFIIDQMQEIDQIAIAGNLIDNAMEAACKCEKGYVKIYMFTQNENHFSVIKIVNNYTGEIKQRDGALLTSKSDGSKHGYGVLNVSRIAKKYGGYLQNFYEEGVFTSIVILPVKDI